MFRGRLVLPRSFTATPRRVVAALCFVLAVASALPRHRPSPADGTDRIPVPAGLVATSAAVYADGLTFVRPGDHIDLVTSSSDPAGQSIGVGTSTLVAQDVQVLAIRPPPATATPPRIAQLLVAAPHALAVQIATHQGAQAFVAVTAPP